MFQKFLQSDNWCQLTKQYRSRAINGNKGQVIQKLCLKNPFKNKSNQFKSFVRLIPSIKCPLLYNDCSTSRIRFFSKAIFQTYFVQYSVKLLMQLDVFIWQQLQRYFRTIETKSCRIVFENKKTRTHPFQHLTQKFKQRTESNLNMYQVHLTSHCMQWLIPHLPRINHSFLSLHKSC